MTAWPTINGAPGYAPVGGTSLAAPVVAGIAGLLFSARPSLTGSQVEQTLEQTAVPVPFPVAYGRVDALAALTSLGFSDPQPSSLPVNSAGPQMMRRDKWRLELRPAYGRSPGQPGSPARPGQLDGLGTSQPERGQMAALRRRGCELHGRRYLDQVHGAVRRQRLHAQARDHREERSRVEDDVLGALAARGRCFARAVRATAATSSPTSASTSTSTPSAGADEDLHWHAQRRASTSLSFPFRDRCRAGECDAHLHEVVHDDADPARLDQRRRRPGLRNVPSPLKLTLPSLATGAYTYVVSGSGYKGSLSFSHRGHRPEPVSATRRGLSGPLLVFVPLPGHA